MGDVADLVSAAADDSPEEISDYRRGYEDGLRGRAMRSNAPSYIDGWSDGLEDYEIENQYCSDNDCADWSW